MICKDFELIESMKNQLDEMQKQGLTDTPEYEDISDELQSLMVDVMWQDLEE